MKTSSSQFDLMVTFMEQHRDLSKPSSNARDRISNLNKWEELVQLLNSGSGTTKTTEKWKKVWADFKNNTKKKAVRLHKSAHGGGRTMRSKLTDLEQRVLNLIGVQVATSLGVEEAGLSQVSQIKQPHGSIESPQHVNEPHLPVQRPHSDEPMPSTSYVAPVRSPNQASTVTTPVIVHNIGEAEEDAPALSPFRLSSQGKVIRPEPARSGQTSPHRARLRRSLRRLRILRPAHTELAAQNYLQAKEFWRKFRIEQHRDYISLRREQNRIREMEVQNQREWQAIGIRVLEMLDKLVDRICND